MVIVKVDERIWIFTVIIGFVNSQPNAIRHTKTVKKNLDISEVQLKYQNPEKFQINLFCLWVEKNLLINNILLLRFI